MKVTMATVLILVVAVSGFGDGGGGMLFGYQTSHYPFLENYEIANNSLNLVYFGGYGYGISGTSGIIGGFGQAFMSVDGASGIAGGVGGIVAGVRIFSRPITLSLVSWTGLGGIYTGTHETDSGKGFFALSEEITVEIGLPILRWFMPTVFAGYQVAGNLIPGTPLTSFFSYTPVVGLRLQWGRFY